MNCSIAEETISCVGNRQLGVVTVTLTLVSFGFGTLLLAKFWLGPADSC